MRIFTNFFNFGKFVKIREFFCWCNEFSIYGGKAAAWITMPHGTMVRHGPSDIVLGGDPAHSPAKRGEGHSNPHHFPTHVLWPNGWMDQDATWHGGWPRPRPHCVRWGLSSPLKRGTEPPTYRFMSIVAKRLDGSRCHLVEGCRPRLRRHCVRWGPSYPQRGTAPNFWSMFLEAKRLDG